ncbi:MAG: depupylase/deamidase Dop [Acidimicrobiia bacterium]|nr:depupylase/deamidase Dop [Acidimicrobiia bacterium]
MPKVLGTETEFGVTIRHQVDFNPALASALVVNSYEGGRVRVQWSFEEESPGRDARGFGFETHGVTDIDTGLVNVVLTNGARLYVDHAHPEYSTPECADPYEAALFDKAGETVMALAARNAQMMLRDGEELRLHKNNSDGKGNSYGAHENYLLPRDLPFSDIIQYATTWMVTRQIFTGSGKLGSENGRPAVDYQLTQRADFFEEEVGLETTLKRPIINTRDEPHGDVAKYRRLHVIIGDANMSELQTFLKLGTTALFLSAVEDGALPESFMLADPVEACWSVSHDMGMRGAVELDTGGSVRPLDLQFRYLEALTKYVEQEMDGEVWTRILDEWECVLDDLERDPLATADRLDWAAKYQMLEGFRERDSLEWDDPKLAMIGLQYHDVDPKKGLYYRLANRGSVRRLFTDDQVAAAVIDPPTSTRAYFRGRCVAQYPDSLVAANWDSLVFDTGESTLKRVPMMEPLRGTRDHVAELLDQAPDAAELIEALGGP